MPNKSLTKDERAAARAAHRAAAKAHRAAAAAPDDEETTTLAWEATEEAYRLFGGTETEDQPTHEEMVEEHERTARRVR